MHMVSVAGIPVSLSHLSRAMIANDLGGRASPAMLPALGNERPIPTDHGFGCDDQECLFPAGPEPAKKQPENPVEQAEPWARMTPFQHGMALFAAPSRRTKRPSLHSGVDASLGLHCGLRKMHYRLWTKPSSERMCAALYRSRTLSVAPPKSSRKCV